MEEYETRAFNLLFERDVTNLYIHGLIDTDVLLDFASDRMLMRCVEDAFCGHAFNSLVVDKLARNLYVKWSNLVAEVAIYDKLQHGTPTVELQGPYL